MLAKFINTEIAGEWVNWFIVLLMVVFVGLFLALVFPTAASQGN